MPRKLGREHERILAILRELVRCSDILKSPKVALHCQFAERLGDHSGYDCFPTGPFLRTPQPTQRDLQGSESDPFIGRKMNGSQEIDEKEGYQKEGKEKESNQKKEETESDQEDKKEKREKGEWLAREWWRPRGW